VVVIGDIDGAGPTLTAAALFAWWYRAGEIVYAGQRGVALEEGLIPSWSVSDLRSDTLTGC
jgi:hypothetical protein